MPVRRQEFNSHLSHVKWFSCKETILIIAKTDVIPKLMGSLHSRAFFSEHTLLRHIWYDITPNCLLNSISKFYILCRNKYSDILLLVKPTWSKPYYGEYFVRVSIMKGSPPTLNIYDADHLKWHESREYRVLWSCSWYIYIALLSFKCCVYNLRIQNPIWNRLSNILQLSVYLPLFLSLCLHINFI